MPLAIIFIVYDKIVLNNPAGYAQMWDCGEAATMKFERAGNTALRRSSKSKSLAGSSNDKLEVNPKVAAPGSLSAGCLVWLIISPFAFVFLLHMRSWRRETYYPPTHFQNPPYLNVRNSQLKACQEAALVPSLLGAAEVGQPQPC